MIDRSRVPKTVIVQTVSIKKRVSVTESVEESPPAHPPSNKAKTKSVDKHFKRMQEHSLEPLSQEIVYNLARICQEIMESPSNLAKPMKKLT